MLLGQLFCNRSAIVLFRTQRPYVACQNVCVDVAQTDHVVAVLLACGDAVLEAANAGIDNVLRIALIGSESGAGQGKDGGDESGGTHGDGEVSKGWIGCIKGRIDECAENTQSE